VPGCPIQRFRICVGDHPDDVQKWIEDRKRKFPRFSKKGSSNRGDGDGGDGGDSVAKEALRNIEKTTKPNEQAGAADNGKVGGLSSLLEGYGSSSSSEEEEEDDDGIEDDKKSLIKQSSAVAATAMTASHRVIVGDGKRFAGEDEEYGGGGERFCREVVEEGAEGPRREIGSGDDASQSWQ